MGAAEDVLSMLGTTTETPEQLVRDWYAAVKGMETSDMAAKLTAQRRVVDFERKLMTWAASHSVKAE